MIEEKLLIDCTKSAFNSLPELFQKLFAKAEVFELTAQQFLKKNGDLYLFLSGFLIEQDQNQNCIRFIKNGDVLFIDQILSSSDFNNSFRALSDCYLLKLPLAQIRLQVNQNPLYYLDILNIVTKSLKVLEELSVNKITLPLRFQLFKLIQQLNTQLVYYNYPIIPVTKKLLQNYLSCSSSNLNRLLTELEKKDLIQFLGKGFCVKNLKLLDKLMV